MVLESVPLLVLACVTPLELAAPPVAALSGTLVLLPIAGAVKTVTVTFDSTPVLLLATRGGGGMVSVEFVPLLFAPKMAEQ